MTRLAVALSLVALPAPIVAQATRWAVRIESPAGIEHGELRLEGKTGRLLLESRDSAYITLTQFEQSAGRLSFAVAPMGARVSADLFDDGTRMQGWLTASNGARRGWQGERIAPGTVQWPVRPRLRVRQLLFGSGADVTIIPAAWVHALPDSARLEAEYQRLAQDAGVPAVPATRRADRSQAMVLGADDSSRALVRHLLKRIAAGPSADTAFRRIFVGDNGIRLDVHERAEEYAALRYRPFVYADAARALALDRQVPLDAVSERSRTRQAVLSLWSRWKADDSTTLARIHEVQGRDRAAWRALIALLEGYDQAMPWWHEAVLWLLQHPWLETPGGSMSVVQRVSQLWSWGGSAPRLPEIAPVVSGGFAATPMLAADRLARRIIEPLNASAREWLEVDRMEALAAWRSLRWDDSLTIDSKEYSATLLSPFMATRSSLLGGLLATEDCIEIDPSIVPLFAVATVIHEWLHILATSYRLAAVNEVNVNGTLQIPSEDPWLAEGLAEWETEEALRPFRESVPLLSFVDLEKRMALWGGMSEDPHALGYRLVRAAAEHVPPGSARKVVAIYLDDPGALAGMARFPATADARPLLLRRPKTMSIVPEITFTWDGGVADHPVRRLALPLFPPER